MIFPGTPEHSIFGEIENVHMHNKPNIIAIARTKSNPWYRSCLSTLIYSGFEVFEAVENCPSPVILASIFAPCSLSDFRISK